MSPYYKHKLWDLISIEYNYSTLKVLRPKQLEIFVARLLKVIPTSGITKNDGSGRSYRFGHLIE